MIIYFADRKLNILGQATTYLPHGLKVTDDKMIEDVETGVASFECEIPFDDATRKIVEECTECGNYILYANGDETEFFTITEAEIDTKLRTVYLYAEDDGMDLLNVMFEDYEADKAYPIDHYINKWAAGTGFVIRTNEAKGLTRKLVWDGEDTGTARIASTATQFDGCEVAYGFEVEGLMVTKKYIDIYKKRGKDVGATLWLNKDIDSIITSKSINNLATALSCTGGTPDDDDTPITLKGYSYDDGDFYVDGKVLKSRNALKQWARYQWKDDDTALSGGHIVKPYSFDTTSQKTLCTRAITELKKLREMEVNYKVDILKLPDNVRIGDRVNIVDEKGELYLSARVLQLETSEAAKEYKAVIGEYLIKSSGIHQRVIELAEQFAAQAHSAARALELAKNANTAATQAKAQVDEAVKSVEEAQRAVEEVADVVEEAKVSAAAAQTAASNAQSIVDVVENQLTGMETTVANAQAAAEQAQQAAATADAKAIEAKAAADKAQTKADSASIESVFAQRVANSAVSKADTAQTTAEQAIADAEAAATTAAAAKLDAAQAKADILALGETLTTVENTMAADYARKTDLTETEASLQSQILQNAAVISSTVSMLTTIDETANDAESQAEKAQKKAQAAKQEADKATADAEAAQQAADEAAAAASVAQAEADTAREAADAAQAILDKARADLAQAQANLEAVIGRADATEAEIAEAQAAVNSAQIVADNAWNKADTATDAAANAQAIATAALHTAQEAQAVANAAASYAKIAQAVANEAEDAEAAQIAADEAAETARAAQTKANEAADAAQAATEAAQKAADDAAQAVADSEAADAQLSQAAAALVEAEKRLDAVLADAKATEAEIAEARAAVDAAQVEVNEALERATAAAAYAATAAIDAANAQMNADRAKAAADAAQAAADEAQSAADKAQADVDALAVRVTTAETKITQNAEKIELAATKTEVANTLGGYYTKTQTDAAMQVTAEAVTSTVRKEIAEADEATAETTGARLTSAESAIQQLADSISMLVRSGESGSLVKQDANGFYYFDISEIENSIDSTAGGLNSLSGIVLNASGEIDVLKSTAEALRKRTEYIRSYTDENDNPCLELGEGDSQYRAYITNTGIRFEDDTEVPTSISRRMLVIEKTVVRDSLQFGDEEKVSGVWIWKRRSNRNLGLSWKDGGN